MYRSDRRRCKQQMRPWFETLERRDCPAVTFEFIQGDAGGVLRVTGDDGPNSIEIFQPRDRRAVVSGDGEVRTFDGVDEIFVATLGGADAAHSSKPKEIVVVGAKLHFDMGAGNDRLKVDGAQPDGSILIPRVKWEVAVDLGTGNDALSVEAADSDAVNLDVQSGDGFDSVSVDLGFPAVQQIRPAAARVSMKLGGGANRIDVSATNFDQVDLELAVAGGGNAVHGGFDLSDGYMDEDHPPYCAMSLDFGGGGNFVDLNAQEFDQADLQLRAAGGNNVVKHQIGHTIGLRHEHTRPEARIDMDFAGGGNLVDVRMQNVKDVDVSIVSMPTPGEPATGGTINVYWHVINNSSSANAGRMDGVVILTSSLPGGSAIGVSPTSLSFLATAGGASSPSSANLALDLGADNDSVSIQSKGVEDVQLNVHTGGGNDIVLDDTEGGEHVQASIDTGSGDDLVLIATRFDAGTRQASFDIDLSLGAGHDLALLDVVGYSLIAATIDTGPARDGRDLVLASFRLSPLERTRRVHRLADGGQDVFELQIGAGYDTRTTFGETTAYVLIGTPPLR